MSAALLSFAVASNPRELLEALLPDIRDAVSAACYHYSVDRGEIEDAYHQIILLLMEDDYRRLRLFDKKSSARTWLRTIALHYVSNYVSRQRRSSSLDEISPVAFVTAAAQEAELISEQRRCDLQEAVSKLTARERELFELLCRDDLTSAEVARHMGIKVESVHRRKHALIKKLRGLINGSVHRREALLRK